jgi:hypothetical protein
LILLNLPPDRNASLQLASSRSPHARTFCILAYTFITLLSLPAKALGASMPIHKPGVEIGDELQADELKIRSSMDAAVAGETRVQIRPIRDKGRPHFQQISNSTTDQNVSVTRGTTSHGEAEMAKVSDYGIFDFGYAK